MFQKISRKDLLPNRQNCIGSCPNERPPGVKTSLSGNVTYLHAGIVSAATSRTN